DVDAPAVEIAVEIEEMRFEQWLGAVDGRPDAEARDAGHRMPRDAVHAHGEDAADRRHAPAEADVRGRIAELAAELRAAHDMATDRERAAEQPRRRCELAVREMRADRARADALAVERDVGKDADREAVARTEFLQQRDVTATRMAEAEIAADPDLARAAAL